MERREFGLQEKLSGKKKRVYVLSAFRGVFVTVRWKHIGETWGENQRLRNKKETGCQRSLLLLAEIGQRQLDRERCA